MRVHCSSRRAASAALAIVLLVLPGTATVAGAAASRDGSGRDEAPGQAKRPPAPERSSRPPAEPPAAADDPDGHPSHDATNGPGGQVCDGDPSGRSDGGGGANGGGDHYDATCPAGPSQNGAGGGAARGRPCAGCVGNADDKNPPGQYPSGPGDRNNGYECEPKGRRGGGGNNGIGSGNPAHTACAPSTAPAVAARSTEVLGVRLSAPPASPPVLAAPPATPPVLAAPSAAPPVLAAPPATPPAVASPGLARTGGFQLTALVQVALLLGLAGAGLVVGARRRLGGDVVDIAERLRGY